VAQLVSASPCHGEGRGFESRLGRNITSRPGSSVGTSVRLKSGRSAVRPRPWPRSLVAPTCSLRSLRGAIVDYFGGPSPPNPPRAAFGGLAFAIGGLSFWWGRVRSSLRASSFSLRGTSASAFLVSPLGVRLSESPSAGCPPGRLSFRPVSAWATYLLSGVGDSPFAGPDSACWAPPSFLRGASSFLAPHLLPVLPAHVSCPRFLVLWPGNCLCAFASLPSVCSSPDLSVASSRCALGFSTLMPPPTLCVSPALVTGSPSVFLSQRLAPCLGA
jgi:hypothetical protein